MAPNSLNDLYRTHNNLLNRIKLYHSLKVPHNNPNYVRIGQQYVNVLNKIYTKLNKTGNKKFLELTLFKPSSEMKKALKVTNILHIRDQY